MDQSFTSIVLLLVISLIILGITVFLNNPKSKPTAPVVVSSPQPQSQQPPSQPKPLEPPAPTPFSAISIKPVEDCPQGSVKRGDGNCYTQPPPGYNWIDVSSHFYQKRCDEESFPNCEYNRA